MLNRHKDELSLEWDKRWEHLQLGKKTALPFPLTSVPLSSSPASFSFKQTVQKIGRNQQLRLMNVCL